MSLLLLDDAPENVFNESVTLTGAATLTGAGAADFLNAVLLGGVAALIPTVGKTINEFVTFAPVAGIAGELPDVSLDPITMTMRVIEPLVTMGLIATPAIASATMSVVPPTVTVGPTNVPVQPIRMTMRVVEGVPGAGGGLTVTVGAVPELKVVRVVSRFAVRIIDVADGFERT